MSIRTWGWPQAAILLAVLISLGVLVSASQDGAPKSDRPSAGKKAALPLKPTARLEFETDEGTWISLDVTPDGSTVVFELLGDLYTVPIAGGDAKRITEGLPFDCQPAISPDGTLIAFISDRGGSDNLWIANADGTTPRKLSSESQDAVISPAWTGDGQYVIVSVRGNRGTELRMFHVNGGSGVSLAPPAPDEDTDEGPRRETAPARLGATAAPDGRYVYSRSRPAGHAASFRCGRWPGSTCGLERSIS